MVFSELSPSYGLLAIRDPCRGRQDQPPKEDHHRSNQPSQRSEKPEERCTPSASRARRTGRTPARPRRATAAVPWARQRPPPPRRAPSQRQYEPHPQHQRKPEPATGRRPLPARRPDARTASRPDHGAGNACPASSGPTTVAASRGPARPDKFRARPRCPAECDSSTPGRPGSHPQS